MRGDGNIKTEATTLEEHVGLNCPDTYAFSNEKVTGLRQYLRRSRWLKRYVRKVMSRLVEDGPKISYDEIQTMEYPGDNGVGFTVFSSHSPIQLRPAGGPSR